MWGRPTGASGERSPHGYRDRAERPREVESRDTERDLEREADEQQAVERQARCERLGVNRMLHVLVRQERDRRQERERRRESRRSGHLPRRDRDRGSRDHKNRDAEREELSGGVLEPPVPGRRQLARALESCGTATQYAAA